MPHNYQIQFIWFLCTQCVIYELIVRGRNTPFTSVSLALPHRQCCAQKVDSSGRLKPCLLYVAILMTFQFVYYTL